MQERRHVPSAESPSAVEPKVIVANGQHHKGVDPKPLLCTLEKKSNTDEFGFNLHAERGKGHFIGKVDEASIAHKAGLVLGQRIVGVNGTLVYPTSPHADVVALIRTNPLKTQLLVAAESVDEHFTKHGLVFSFAHADEFNADHPPPVYISRHSSIHEQAIVSCDHAHLQQPNLRKWRIESYFIT